MSPDDDVVLRDGRRGIVIGVDGQTISVLIVALEPEIYYSVVKLPADTLRVVPTRAPQPPLLPPRFLAS